MYSVIHVKFAAWPITTQKKKKKNSQRACFLRNTTRILDTDTLHITSSYLAIQEASPKLEITREPPWKTKHCSVLLKFTFKIRSNLLCMDYICFVAISSCQNGRTGNADLYSFISGIIKAPETTVCVLGQIHPILSGRTVLVILLYHEAAGLPGLAGPPWLPFSEASVWLPDSGCLIHPVFIKRMFQKALVAQSGLTLWPHGL